MDRSISTRPARLSTATLTIPCPTDPPSHTGSTLKLRVTPYLSLPCPPFAAGAAGSKIEDCVDVVVDIGGKVELGLEVDEENLAAALALSGSEGHEAVWEAEKTIKRIVTGVFCANRNIIGLHQVSSALSPPMDSPEASPSPQLEPRSTPPLLHLTPLISSPAHNHHLKVLCTTGKPRALLSRLDIKLEWRSRTGIVEMDHQEEPEEAEDSQESGQSHEVGDESASWDDDEFCMDTDGDSGGDPLSAVHPAVHGYPGEDARDGVLPAWMLRQIRVGIQKVIRVHMIRRFPLLFDSALLSYSEDISPHRSLVTSLTRFINLSLSHSTGFRQPAQKLVQAIAHEQETFVTLHVGAAARIRGGRPSSRTAMKTKAKRRRIDENEESKARPDSPNARTEQWMRHVQQQIQEEDAGPRMHERSLQRLVAETMGRIGRARWEAGRKGTGRMAAFRMPLAEEDTVETGDGPTRHTSISENYRPPSGETSPVLGLLLEESDDVLESQDQTSHSDNHQYANADMLEELPDWQSDTENTSGNHDFPRAPIGADSDADTRQYPPANMGDTHEPPHGIDHIPDVGKIGCHNQSHTVTCRTCAKTSDTDEDEAVSDMIWVLEDLDVLDDFPKTDADTESTQNLPLSLAPPIHPGEYEGEEADVCDLDDLLEEP